MSGARVIDLLRAAPPESRKCYDFCVVGAGAIGLLVAHRLCRSGATVAIIDRGPRRPQHGTPEGEVEFDMEPYTAATEGRDFGLGGSTSRWGGLLVPHLDCDRRSDAAWELIVATVNDRSEGVLRTLGWTGTREGRTAWLGHPTLGETAEFGGAVKPVCSLYLPFRRKNLAWLLTSPDGRAGWTKPDLYLNAVTADWHVSGSDPPSIVSVAARSRNGAEARVVAGRFIIAAGAIESTRIALELAESLPTGCLPGAAQIGSCLSDHLSVSIGQLPSQAGRWAAEHLGFWFQRGWMRGSRFVGIDPSRFEARSFLHPVFHGHGRGFGALREALRSVQRRERPRLGTRQCLAALPSLPAFAFHRYVKARVYLEPGTECRMQLDTEQAPDPANRIYLKHGAQDWSGRAKVGIKWQISRIDRERIRKAARSYREAWESTAGLPPWEGLGQEVDDRRAHDAYHPVGTCRLGLDDEAVVDSSLRLRGLGNGWIASTAVLPTAGTANPTMSALCLADHAVRAMLEAPGGPSARSLKA